MKKAEIISYLDTAWVARNLVVHEETVSTNLDAKQLAEEGVEGHGYLRQERLFTCRSCFDLRVSRSRLQR